MESSWKAFLADQEWIDIKKRTAAEHGELVKEANGQPLVRQSFSPACNKKSGWIRNKVSGHGTSAR